MMSALTKKELAASPADGSHKIEILDVSPEMAARWLKANVCNRPIQSRNLQMIKDDMNNGRWFMAYDPVRFDQEGRLIDGQHRLTAIAETGLTFPMLVVFDLNHEVFQVLDTGRVRSGSDVLVIEGLGKQQARTLSTAATLAIRHEQTNNAWNTNLKVTNQDIVSYIRARPALTSSSEVIQMLARQAPPISKGVGCFLHFLFSAKDAALADDIMERLYSGTNLHQQDPVHVVREAICRSQMIGYPWPSQKRAFGVARAWNWTRQGRKCKHPGNLMRDDTGSYVLPEIL